MLSGKRPLSDIRGNGKFAFYPVSQTGPSYDWSIPDTLFKKLSKYNPDKPNFIEYDSEKEALQDLQRAIKEQESLTQKLVPMEHLGKFQWLKHNELESIANQKETCLLSHKVYMELRCGKVDNGVLPRHTYNTLEEAMNDLNQALGLPTQPATKPFVITKVKVYGENGVSVTAPTFEEAKALVEKAPSKEKVDLVAKVVSASLCVMNVGTALGHFQSLMNAVSNGNFTDAMEKCRDDREKKFVTKMKEILWG